MRTLSFATWLRRTLQQLSATGTTSPSALAKELPGNPRLLEPLCLYTAVSLETERRCHLLRRFPYLEEEFRAHALLKLSGEALVAALQQSADAEDPYSKLWKSYQYTCNRKQADDHTKALIHRKVRQLQAEKHISNYRIYTDLHLNPGNLNAYLRNSDCSKLSLETARKTLRYLQGV